MASLSSFLLAVKFIPLSESTLKSIRRQFWNRLKAIKKELASIDSTGSMWYARVTRQVNKIAHPFPNSSSFIAFNIWYMKLSFIFEKLVLSCSLGHGF